MEGLLLLIFICLVFISVELLMLYKLFKKNL